MATQHWEFIRTPTYEAAAKGDLSEDAERVHVEDRLIADPRAGDLLVGTGGFRKLRVPLPWSGQERRR